MKLLFIIFLGVITSNVYSQIKVLPQESEVEVKIGHVGGNPKSADIQCMKIGNRYIFLYRNIKYKHIIDIRSFSFYDEEEDFDNLYKLLNGLFDSKPDQDTVVELPDDKLWFKVETALGISMLNITHESKGTFGQTRSISRKQLKKLFGK